MDGVSSGPSRVKVGDGVRSEIDVEPEPLLSERRPGVTDESDCEEELDSLATCFPRGGAEGYADLMMYSTVSSGRS